MKRKVPKGIQKERRGNVEEEEDWEVKCIQCIQFRRYTQTNMYSRGKGEGIFEPISWMLACSIKPSFCVRPHPSSLLSSGRPVDRSDHVQTEKSMRRRRRRQHGRRAALSRRSNLWNLFSTFYVQRSTTASLETNIIIIKYIRVNRILTKNGPRDNMSCFCCPSTLTVW